MEQLVVGDLYNRIFSSQLSNPELKVDYEIWTPINIALPVGYLLPDQSVWCAVQHRS